MIFKNLLPNTKVWVYVSRTSLSNIDFEDISLNFNQFFSNWKSHGEIINGQFKIIDDYILSIAADVKANELCGRAADAQVRFIEEVSKHYKLDLLNRNNMAYLENGVINSFDFRKLKELLEAGKINNNTLCCNTFVRKNSDQIYLPFSQSPFASLSFSR
tara:strand:- start:11667 stop:12143 length:477 start_codon:yes stop_codon:yes gene_type:complete